MSGVNAIKHKPTRDEIKALRIRVSGLEDTLSGIVQNNQIVTASGLQTFYVQATEPAIGDTPAIWLDTSDGSIKIRKELKTTGAYGWTYMGDE